MHGIDRSRVKADLNFAHLDAALDEALKQSFPASDPIAVSFPDAVSRQEKRPPAAPPGNKGRRR